MKTILHHAHAVVSRKRAILVLVIALIPLTALAALIRAYTCQGLPREVVLPGYGSAGLPCSEDTSCSDGCEKYSYIPPTAGNCVEAEWWRWCNQNRTSATRVVERGSCDIRYVVGAPVCTCVPRDPPITNYISATCQ